MTAIDFEKFETLSEEEKEAASSLWTNEDWCDYYKFMGTVTIDDFFEELEKEALTMAKEKYSLVRDTNADKTNEQTMNE